MNNIDLALATVLEAEAVALEQQAMVQSRYKNHKKWNEALLVEAEGKRAVAKALREEACT
jgi:hypothetical protein